ncbi:MAG: ribbon-helix-helix domain-containing protein [Candidatus Bathycorpusculaceae bacterium]
MDRDIAFWNVHAPRVLDDAVEAAVRQRWYKTKSEFIREAVRRELERLGVKPSLANER